MAIVLLGALHNAHQVVVVVQLRRVFDGQGTGVTSGAISGTWTAAFLTFLGASLAPGETGKGGRGGVDCGDEMV